MPLKDDWEKTSELISIDDTIIKNMVANTLPDYNLLSYNIIASGCVNLNIKLFFEDKDPLLLRIYLRDKKAALKEQQIINLVKDKIPVAKIIHVGELSNYIYSISEFIVGITLKDLLLNNKEDNFKEIIYKAGQVVAKLQEFKFDISGEFDNYLQVKPFPDDYEYLKFAKNCLNNKWVKKVLNREKISKLQKILEEKAGNFPDNSNATLTHADFDPANILVNKINGKWQIVAILDWEFSYAGSYLQDIANFLRYAHQMPNYYKMVFWNSLYENGINLPNNWQLTIHLLNIISLLDCLTRYDPSSRPNRLKDIKELINFIIDDINEMDNVNKENVYQNYDLIYGWFDKTRSKDLMEKEYLNLILDNIPSKANILDLGCGTGDPIAKFFIEKGHNITGIDGAKNMIALCKERFPEKKWQIADMRKIDLQQKFNAIIAWDSFFHLPHDDQRYMFSIFKKHSAKNTILLFTSGPDYGEVVGDMNGKKFYHASLSIEEYKKLLQDCGFNLILNKIEDENCGHHTVWLAKYEAD